MELCACAQHYMLFTKQPSYGSSFSHETTIWPPVNSSQEHCGVAHKLYHWHLQTHWKKGFRTKNFVYTYFVTTFWAFWSPGTPPGTLASSGTGGNVTHSSHNTDTLLKKTASHMHYGCTVTVVSIMWHTWAVTRTHGCDQFVRHCSKFFLFNDFFLFFNGSVKNFLPAAHFSLLFWEGFFF